MKGLKQTLRTVSEWWIKAGVVFGTVAQRRLAWALILSLALSEAHSLYQLGWGKRFTEGDGHVLTMLTIAQCQTFTVPQIRELYFRYGEYRDGSREYIRTRYKEWLKAQASEPCPGLERLFAEMPQWSVGIQNHTQTGLE